MRCVAGHIENKIITIFEYKQIKAENNSHGSSRRDFQLPMGAPGSFQLLRKLEVPGRKLEVPGLAEGPILPSGYQPDSFSMQPRPAKK